MLQVLIDALLQQDYTAVSACFAPGMDTRYIDYGPACVGKESFHVYGSNAIELFFRNAFYNNDRDFSPVDFYSIHMPKILDMRTASFFGCYEGQYLPVRLTIEAVDGQGRIRKAVVRPE